MKPMREILLIVIILSASANVIAGQETADPGDTLRQYVAQLQNNPDDPELREKIINLALTMNPPPAVPEDAQRFLVRGNAAMKSASTPQDVQDAVTEFRKATLVAPWFAAAYYNLAIVQGKAEDYQGAISNLKLYMLAAPNAPNLQDVKNLSYEMEYKAEKTQKQHAEDEAAKEAQQRAAAQQQATLSSLSGAWTCSQGCISANVSVFGGNFQVSIVSGQNEKDHMYYDDRHRLAKYGTYQFTGTMNGFNVEGTQTEPSEYDAKTHCDVPGDQHSFTGQINSQGTMISLRTELSSYMTHGSYQGSLLLGGWKCDDIRLESRHPAMVILVRAGAGVSANPPASKHRGLFASNQSR